MLKFHYAQCLMLYVYSASIFDHLAPLHISYDHVIPANMSLSIHLSMPQWHSHAQILVPFSSPQLELAIGLCEKL